MKLYEILEKTSSNVYVYESYYDTMIGICDGKSGVSLPVLASDVEYISLDKDDNAICVRVSFDVYDFIDENICRIYGN